MRSATALLGIATGLFPHWLDRPNLRNLQRTIGGITADRRLQLLLIAFAFGAFFEGASGFGTPVAVTGAILMGLGFSPLADSGLSLIANTSTGRLWRARHTDRRSRFGHWPRSLPIGRDGRTPVAIFSLAVPFGLIWTFAGRRGMLEIWSVIIVSGASFAVPQYLMSNFINPWIGRRLARR